MASYSTPRVLGEALYILDGNVGLGTTLPRSVLDIQSTLPVVINTTAGVGIGTVQPVVSFEVHSTDSFLLPKGTTQDRPQGIHGYVRYNTDTQQFEGFGAGDAWGTLGGTKDVNQDTYISAETFPGSNDDALRFITCNIERMRIDSQGNIGIGTNLTDAKIDIYASNETVGLRLRQDGTGDVFNIWGSNNSLFTMLANGNIGIGTVQPKDTFHVETGMYASNAFTSNLVIWNSLYVPLTATRLRTRIQVHHIRKSFYVSEPTQSIFTVEYPGAFTGHQSNVQVFLGRNQLSYVSPTVKDYDLTVTYNMPSLQTEYNVTLLRPAKYGDIVDIIVWPQITQDSPEEQGIVYQGVQVNDSYWLEQDKDLPIRSNVPIYVLGDVGIGTTQPNAKLDIYGNIQIKGNIIPHTCNVYNLGHPDYRFKDIYLSGNTIDIGGTTITRDTDTGGLNILSDQGVPLDTSVRNLYTSANIGVGMSNPAYPLDVAGSAQFAGHVLPASNLIYDLGSSNQRFKDVYLSGNTIDLDGTLLRKHVTGPLMVMSSSNNELQMQSTITRHIYVEGTAHSSNTIITGYDPSKTTLDVHENSSATIATFRNASNTVLLLQNDGNLGIGTISPSSTLTVSGNISIGAYAEISAPPQGMILSGNLGVGTTQPGSALSVLDGVSIGAYAGTTAPTQGMILSGNLGVGTTQPGSALSVLDGVSIGAYAGTTAPPQGMIVSGNIGINTPQPMYPLHIEGNLYASGTVFASNLQVLGDFVRMDTVTSNTEQMVITNDGTGPALTVTQKGAQPIADFYDDSDVLTMRVADNGNVGIGTSTPTQKLDVEGTVKATLFSGSGASLTSLNADQITTGTVVVSRGGTGSNILTANKVLIGNGTDGILQPTLLHWDNTNSRLGIGTISPNNSLHIYDNASVSAIVVDQRGTGNIAEFLDASVKKVVIDGSGNVGIGTQTPLRPLDVYASSTVPTLVVDQRGTGNIAEFLNAGTKKVIIDGTGNVGIGTQTPLRPLDVYANSTVPTLVVDQRGTGNIAEFLDAGVKKVVIDSSGYVGIGTQTPTTPAHTIGTVLSQVNGTHSTGETLNGVHSFIAYAPSGTTANASIWMGYDPTADCGYINSARSGTTRPVCLQTRGSSVGIGTTNPRSIVDIFGSSTTPALLIDQRGSGNIVEFLDAGAKRVVIDGVGNVGIGTTTPVCQLELWGNQAVYGHIGRWKSLPINHGASITWYYMMAIAMDGQVYHAGVDADGISGTYNYNPDLAALRRASIPNGETIKQITVGASYCHALTYSNKILSWGRNQHGILGRGDTTDSASRSPIQISTVADTILYVVTEGANIGANTEVYRHSGYITSTGRVFLWGYNNEGQLANGGTAANGTPTEIAKISSQNWGGMALTMLSTFLWTDSASGNKLYASGYNGQGQLGVGDTANKTALTAVTKADGSHLTNVKTVKSNTHWYSSGGGVCTYVLTNNGDLYTCGYNGYGQLGNGNTTNQSRFQGPILTNVVDFDLVRGSYATGVVAVKGDGTVWVWGLNSHQAFGVGTNIADGGTRTTPYQVPGITNGIRVYGPKIHGYGCMFLQLSDKSWWYAGQSYYMHAGIGDNTRYSTWTLIPTPEEIVDIRVYTNWHINVNADVNWAQFLGKSGRMWGCGYNGHGELGISLYNHMSGLSPIFTSFAG